VLEPVPAALLSPKPPFAVVESGWSICMQIQAAGRPPPARISLERRGIMPVAYGYGVCFSTGGPPGCGFGIGRLSRGGGSTGPNIQSDTTDDMCVHTALALRF
jgi:hypothetical protein